MECQNYGFLFIDDGEFLMDSAHRFGKEKSSENDSGIDG